MPLYDFSCRDCKQPFEKLVRKDADLSTVACPDCSSLKVDKLISMPAKPVSAVGSTATGGGCGVGPPCGAPMCGRKQFQ